MALTWYNIECASQKTVAITHFTELWSFRMRTMRVHENDRCRIVRRFCSALNNVAVLSRAVQNLLRDTYFKRQETQHNMAWVSSRIYAQTCKHRKYVCEIWRSSSGFGCKFRVQFGTLSRTMSGKAPKSDGECVARADKDWLEKVNIPTVCLKLAECKLEFKLQTSRSGNEECQG